MIPGVFFPYGQEVLEQALRERLAISYRFVRNKKGWYVFATTQGAVGKRCTDRAWGMLGVDVGPGNLAVVETDRAGNPVARRTFPLPLYHQTSRQTRALVGDLAARIVEWAQESGKPVALEELEFEAKKDQLQERGKGYSRMLSSFAYRTISEALESRSRKRGVEVLRLNPAYTSTIGIVKFSAMDGLSGDEAAALALARRAQGL